MTGRIIKGIAGFYYVYVPERGIYECKAKGAFRKQGVKPLVGDAVELAVIDEEQKKGNVEEILPRTNELIRPAVANIDMALIVFSMARPEPNLHLLDRFLVMMEFQHLPVTILFNKTDLSKPGQVEEFRAIYESAGYPVLFESAGSGEGIEAVKEAIKGKTVAIAGPSGVGKSTTVNHLQTITVMETQDISNKLKKGKNTTRFSELFPVSDDTYVMDTPGFTSLDVPGMEKEDLWKLYPEFVPEEKKCRFIGCAHLSEPDCGVKQAVEEGRISPVRYENYKLIYEELKNIRKY